MILRVVCRLTCGQEKAFKHAKSAFPVECLTVRPPFRCCCSTSFHLYGSYTFLLDPFIYDHLLEEKKKAQNATPYMKLACELTILLHNTTKLASYVISFKNFYCILSAHIVKMKNITFLDKAAFVL
jgi:sRNA-binding regulator protein Hfq